MHVQPPAQSGAKLSLRLRIRLRRLLRSRSAWAYVLVALVLLGASQVLWLWHSWPVREVLDAERFSGAST